MRHKPAARCRAAYRVERFRSDPLIKLSAAQEAADFVVVEQGEDVKTFRAILEEETQLQVAPTLEGSGAEFPDGQPTVLVQMAERFLQLMQSQQAIGPFGA